MNKELAEAVKLFISQPLNNPLSRGQIMEVARIALPILEQQEMITDNSEVVTDSTVSSDQWIVWCGGSVAPVDGVVEVRWSTGSTDIGHARDFRWEHSRYTINIIAYRIIPEQPTNQNGEQ